MRRSCLRLVPLLLAGLALTACRKSQLEDDLSKMYGPAWVTFAYRDSMHVDSTHLLVTFPASEFAGRPDSTRAATARKVAEYVRDHDPRFKTLGKVTVEFMTRKEMEAGGKHVAARYVFTRTELGEPRP